MEENKKIYLEGILNLVESILPGKSDLVLLSMAVSISSLVDKKTSLWLMFVGAPSSGKTEAVKMLNYYPSIYYLDTITDNAFISGSKNSNGSDPIDLLPLLKGKCLVIKDFTTTLSQREESVKKILGDLTSIYDHSFSKHSPTRGTINYESSFPILGCVTPQALNKHQRYMNQIGPRFLFFRVPISTENETNRGLETMWKINSSETANQLVQKQVSAYCQQIAEKVSEIELEEETSETKNYLNNLAKFIARARGIVITRQAEFENAQGEKVPFYEPLEIQIEEPYRALAQLRTLARSLTVIKNKISVGKEELNLVKSVALSSMPADRSLLLAVIISENRSWTANEVAEKLGISHRTALRQLDELTSLNVLTKKSQGNGFANLYTVVSIFKPILYSKPSEEFMSTSQPTETETPHQTEQTTLEIENLSEDQQLDVGIKVFGEGTKWEK